MAQVGDFVKHYFQGGKQMQYKGEGVGCGARFFKLAWQLDSRGVSVFGDVASAGAKVRWHCAVMVSRCVGVETPFTRPKN